MTAEEIIARDQPRNNPDREIGELFAEVNSIVANGGYAVRSHNTLITFQRHSDCGIEFHTYHAGNSQELLDNCREFLDEIRKQRAQYAITVYRNSRITELLHQLPWDVDIMESEDGRKRALVRLHHELG
jgi:hypothetical protein